MAEHSMCQPGRPGPISVSQLCLALFGSLPQREVAGVILLVLVGVHARRRRSCPAKSFLLSLPYSGNLSMRKYYEPSSAR